MVARAQLVALGLGRGAIDRRVARGLLHVLHRGVFAVGHRRVSRPGHWLAAVLALGPDAVLSHRAAAALWAIRDTARADTDVVVARQRRPRRGIKPHHIALPADEITTERGIPVTTPARTLLDLAEVLTAHQLEAAINEAEYRRLASPTSLEALLTRHPGRRGTAVLRAIVDRGRLGRTITRSDLEIAFLAFLDAHRIQRPLINEPIGPHTVDALWPDQRLVVELDSRQAHDTSHAFEADRARDRDLLTRGFRVARITYRQLQTDQAALAAQLDAVLDGAGSPARTVSGSPRAPATPDV